MAISEAQYRKLVERWPGVALEIKWGDHLVASVDAKMFAMFNLAGAAPGRMHFKVEDELFLSLTEQPGIAPAMYLARAKWVTVVEPKRYPLMWYGERLRRAYEIIGAKLSKKRQRELGLSG
jgi:predicted DNA-binding protein (MmcQ/YjbR family)